MRSRLNRRAVLLLGAASSTIMAVAPSWLGCTRAFALAMDRLAGLEGSVRGRLGVAALDVGSGATLSHRADERFPFCSTFKLLAASALLKRSATENGLLQRHISYSKEDLAPYSPVTSQHAGEGMTLSDLCAAALQYSDNTAANLMIRLLGGPAGVTAFARSIGDDVFRLDRMETALNTALPGDPRDTTTPAAMTRSLQRLALGDVLGPAQRNQLVTWMRGNTTGAKRIRAGVPNGWSVADKTGTGDYGTTNDIGVVWPSGRPPIVLAIYFTQGLKDARPRDDVIASAARIVAEAFG